MQYPHCTLRTANFTMNTAYQTLPTANYTLIIAHYTLKNAHCTPEVLGALIFEIFELSPSCPGFSVEKKRILSENE